MTDTVCSEQQRSELDGTMQQTTFASVAWEKKGKITRRERFLAEMDAVIPWATTAGADRAALSEGG